MEKAFHMKGGVGEKSYFKNSSLQKNVAEMTKDMTLEAVRETYLDLRPKFLGIADLGCSSGLNSFAYIKRLINVLEESAEKIQQQSPELRFYLNDLPTNDFNTIFRALPNLLEELKCEKKGISDQAPSVYISASPGNFYGRVFPDNSLHFSYSFTCLHWLSKVPQGIYNEQGKSLNKRSIYITKNSPPQVLEAYYKQFQEDFSLFLESRSKELVNGGRMVLVLSGRKGSDIINKGNTLLWELLYQSFLNLVAKGKVDEETLESYDVHYYEPCKEEVELQVKKQGSFELERFEINETKMDRTKVTGKMIARSVRAIQESMISHHFGEEILEELFDEYEGLLDQEMAREGDGIEHTHIAMALRKSR